MIDPIEGAVLSDGHASVTYTTLRRVGISFAYVVAARGMTKAHRFTDHVAGADLANIRTGALLECDPCAGPELQAALLARVGVDLELAPSVALRGDTPAEWIEAFAHSFARVARRRLVVRVALADRIDLPSPPARCVLWSVEPNVAKPSIAPWGVPMLWTGVTAGRCLGIDCDGVERLIYVGTSGRAFLAEVG